jgi:hypothetical protein
MQRFRYELTLCHHVITALRGLKRDNGYLHAACASGSGFASPSS